jgi:hypothetical protein
MRISPDSSLTLRLLHYVFGKYCPCRDSFIIANNIIVGMMSSWSLANSRLQYARLCSNFKALSEIDVKESARVSLKSDCSHATEIGHLHYPSPRFVLFKKRTFRELDSVCVLK